MYTKVKENFIIFLYSHPKLVFYVDTSSFLRLKHVIPFYENLYSSANAFIFILSQLYAPACSDNMSNQYLLRLTRVSLYLYIRRTRYYLGLSQTYFDTSVSVKAFGCFYTVPSASFNICRDFCSQARTFYVLFFIFLCFFFQFIDAVISPIQKTFISLCPNISEILIR